MRDDNAGLVARASCELIREALFRRGYRAMRLAAHLVDVESILTES